MIISWELFCATGKAQMIDEIGKTEQIIKNPPGCGGGEGGAELQETSGSRQENAQGRRRVLCFPELQS